MDIEDALLFTDTLVFNHTGLHLSDLQQAMLRESWSWQRQSYDQIADTYGYSPTYLKHDVGPKLWKLLSEVIGEKVNKKNFRAAIERQFHSSAVSHTKTPDAPQSTFRPEICDYWGDAAPSVHNFYGRSTELTQLQDWISSQKCQLVTILGMGGMGKTTLAIKLAHLLESGFEAIIWRSLRNALPFGELLTDWLKVLLPLQINNLETVDSQLSCLLQVLKSQRCLLILDNVETILEEQEISHYREGYEKYSELFRQIGDTQHQSALVLTSRQKPAEVNVLEGAVPRVRSLTLSGLETTEGQKVFQEKGAFQGSQDEWNRLIESYSGNPLALKMISTTIQNLFDGNISDFLNQETFVFGTIRNLIQQQFERLSSSEKTVIYWLAIYRTPATFAELKLDIFPSMAPQKLIETLESLEQRALIERNAAQFSLQPVVMEYVTASFVKKIAQEIQSKLECKPSFFKTHAIIKAQAKDYIRDAQIRLIVKPIIEQLKENLETEIEPFLIELVKKLQLTSAEQVGYAGGNIINLLCQLQNHLSNYDFSNLTIWQANLQQTKLYNIDFSNSDLSRSLFTETLGIVFSVAFSPDGTKLATGDVEGGLRLWEVATNKLLLNFEGHIGWVWSTAWSPDGRILASCSSDKTIRLWDTQTKECINILKGHTSSIWSIAFSPNGEIIASGSDEPIIRLWDVKSGECSKTLRGHTGRILSVTFSQDGQTLASGSDDCTIRIWNVRTGKCQILEGHTNHIWSVVFSGEGNTLFSGSADHSIRLWDISNSTCVNTLKSHTGCVRALQFSPNNKLLISSSDDKTIRIWDLQDKLQQDKLKNNQCLRILSGHKNAVFSISINHIDGTIASGSTDQTVRFWNIQTGDCLKTLKGYTNSVFSVAYSPSGENLASGSTDTIVRLWDINTETCLKTLQGHLDWVTCVAFHPNSKWLASSSVDRTIRLWDINNLTCIKTLHGHTGWVQSVAFSPDGTLLASASDDQTIRLWDVNTFTCLKTLHGHTNWIWAIAFSPDGTLLASSSEDATIRLWSVNTGECTKILEGHTSRIQSIAFHPDGQTLSSASGDQTVRLWSVITGQCLNILHGHENAVWSVNFSPDGKILASSSLDQSIRIWDSKTGTCIKTFSVPTHSVRSSIVLREIETDNYTLTSGSRNGVINIYNTTTGSCVTSLIPNRPYQGTNITNVTGITEAQRDALKANGAIDTANG